MIFVNKENVPHPGFVSLLESTKTGIQTSFKNTGVPKNINGLSFEEIVFNEMVNSAKNTEFNGTVEQTGAHAFPDIIAKKMFGVEVKMTISDKWVSTGNSVLESTRINNIDTIYIFFGKFGKGADFKYRKYQECLYDVGVTHSPRYKIDMDLAANASIFDKIEVSYDNFRKEKFPIKILKEYYRKQLKEGEELWWIDPTAEENIVSPVIKSLRLLDYNVRRRFIIECMILFPEIFGISSTKFDRTAAYLITNYNAVSSNLRDNFTAGGQMVVNINGNPIYVPRILYNLYLSAKEINKEIRLIPAAKLAHYWHTPMTGSPLVMWRKLLSRYSTLAGQIFDEGLLHG